MNKGEHRWDTSKELRTRVEHTLTANGKKIFTAGKTPIAVAVLHQDGKTLDITVFVDRVAKEKKKKKNSKEC